MTNPTDRVEGALRGRMLVSAAELAAALREHGGARHGDRWGRWTRDARGREGLRMEHSTRPAAADT